MHSTFLKSLKLLAKAKESGNAGFERQMTTASRGQGGFMERTPKTNFKGQPVEGQRGRPMRRSRPSRPIEDKRCYECGVLGVPTWDISHTTVPSTRKIHKCYEKQPTIL